VVERSDTTGRRSRSEPHPGRDDSAVGSITASAAVLFNAIQAGIPAGMRIRWATPTGGVAALNHRLMDGIPPG